MMDINIMAVVINLRTAHAPTAQEVLTKYGCIIKTRLGLHETDEKTCSEQGLIILQLCGEGDAIENLRKDLLKVEGVRVNLMKV